MWDIVWTDPDKELVGEHRARKGRAREDKEKSSIRSGRDSAATSASNSSSETPFSFFRSRNARNAVLPRSKNRNRSPSFSGLATPSLTSTLSPFSQTFDSSSRRSSGIITTAPTSPNKDEPEILASSSDRDTFPSFDGCSQLPGSPKPRSPRINDIGAKDSPNIAALIEMLGDVPPKVDPQEIPRSVPPGLESAARPKPLKSEVVPVGALVVTPPKSPTTRNGKACLPDIPDLPESPIFLTPPPKSSRRPAGTALLDINNPAAWRTPSQWREVEAKKAEKAEKALQRITKKVGDERDVKMEKFAVSEPSQGVRAAVGAPTAMILAKFKQILVADDTDTNSVCPESPKQHWMLSLLHGLGYITDPDQEVKSVSAFGSSTLVMMLYEARVYATYLSSAHPNTQVYHLAREAGTGSWSHSIQTLQAPPPEAASFPVAPRLFEAVYSFSLPASCSYNVLPNILNSVNKCLKPGGVFKITIIDPLPYAETVGFRLRNWMEAHLFPNLERSSRSLEPSRLFPKLLGDAGLRGKGSRRTKVKFFALPESARGADYHDPDPSIDRLFQERQDKAELRSLVGRMFWTEVWGRHLPPSTPWWWDDPACVEECRQLGTFWEYHIIDAVRAENVSKTK